MMQLTNSTGRNHNFHIKRGMQCAFSLREPLNFSNNNYSKIIDLPPRKSEEDAIAHTHVRFKDVVNFFLCIAIA